MDGNDGGRWWRVWERDLDEARKGLWELGTLDSALLSGAVKESYPTVADAKCRAGGALEDLAEMADAADFMGPEELGRMEANLSAALSGLRALETMLAESADPSGASVESAARSAVEAGLRACRIVEKALLRAPKIQE